MSDERGIRTDLLEEVVALQRRTDSAARQKRYDLLTSEWQAKQLSAAELNPQGYSVECCLQDALQSTELAGVFRARQLLQDEELNPFFIDLWQGMITLPPVPAQTRAADGPVLARLQLGKVGPYINLRLEGDIDQNAIVSKHLFKGPRYDKVWWAESVVEIPYILHEVAVEDVLRTGGKGTAKLSDQLSLPGTPFTLHSQPFVDETRRPFFHVLRCEDIHLFTHCHLVQNYQVRPRTRGSFVGNNRLLSSLYPEMIREGLSSEKIREGYQKSVDLTNQKMEDFIKSHT